MRSILLFVLLICNFQLQAQDTLWVFQRFQKPYVKHIIRQDESIFTISKLYNVPLAILANENHQTYQEGLKKGQELWIPLDKNNYLQTSDSRSEQLLYTVKDGDDLRTIARMLGVTQSSLQKWNKLPTPQVKIGWVLKIGWVKYDRVHIPVGSSSTSSYIDVKQQSKNSDNKIYKTTENSDNKNELGDILVTDKLVEEFKAQTGGRLIDEESGAASFYPVKTQLDSHVYYAMHKTASRGTIVEVTNPATGKVIYAKVVGKLPALPEYQNSIIALSNNAANPLGANDTKIFCKIVFAK